MPEPNEASGERPRVTIDSATAHLVGALAAANYDPDEINESFGQLEALLMDETEMGLRDLPETLVRLRDFSGAVVETALGKDDETTSRSFETHGKRYTTTLRLLGHEPEAAARGSKTTTKKGAGTARANKAPSEISTQRTSVRKRE